MGKDPLKIQFDPEVLERLRTESERTGKSMAAIVRLAVSAHLDPAPAITDPDVAAVVEAARREGKSRGLAVETIVSMWRRMWDPTVPLKIPVGGIKMPSIEEWEARRAEFRGPSEKTVETELKEVKTKLAILERRLNEKDAEPKS